LKLESPCGYHDFDLYLKYNVKPNLIQFLKVFGKPEGTILPDGKKLIRIKHDDLSIMYIENKNMVKFFIRDKEKTKKLKKLIIRQINKSFNCTNCGACAGSCPNGAISMNPDFHIDENKCTNCLICTGTKYLSMSCIALHYKEKRLLIKLNKI
ncbi:MAG: 4Fe-4S binding protein, partial [Promethearchaeota archaeon]